MIHRHAISKAAGAPVSSRGDRGPTESLANSQQTTSPLAHQLELLESSELPAKLVATRPRKRLHNDRKDLQRESWPEVSYAMGFVPPIVSVVRQQSHRDPTKWAAQQR